MTMQQHEEALKLEFKFHPEMRIEPSYEDLEPEYKILLDNQFEAEAEGLTLDREDKIL